MFYAIAKLISYGEIYISYYTCIYCASQPAYTTDITGHQRNIQRVLPIDDKRNGGPDL